MQSLQVLRRPPAVDAVATVLQSVDLTPTIKSIWLRLDREDFSFLPGQSVWPKFERQGRKFSKIYSIASTPSHCPDIELCVSRVGWSSAYLQDLRVGESIPVRGPYGLMTLMELPQRPRLYIAEGSGIAPFKSQIDWLYEQDFCHPIWLVQANPETPDQLPYESYWRSLHQRWSQFRYLPVTTISPEQCLAQQTFEMAEFDVEICGIGDRVAQLEAAAFSLGAKLGQLRSEKFIAF